MRILTIAAALAVALPGAAQTSPYAAEPPRAIAALSDADISGLLDGAGMGFARAAELNGVPGPRHSLDMAEQLHLDAAQRARLEEIFAAMQSEARRLGARIVEQERGLDALFAAGAPTVDEIRRRTLELGRLEGELRAIHLAAHVETAAVLEDHQVARYAELRGYAASDRTGGAHDAHEH